MQSRTSWATLVALRATLMAAGTSEGRRVNESSARYKDERHPQLVLGSGFWYAGSGNGSGDSTALDKPLDTEGGVSSSGGM